MFDSDEDMAAPELKQMDCEMDMAAPVPKK